MQIVEFIVLAGLGGMVFYLLWKQRTEKAFKIQKDREINRLREEKKAMFDLLHDLGEAFTDTMRIEDLMRIVVNCSMKITMAKGAAMFELDAKKEKLTAIVLGGLFPPLTPLPKHVEHKVVSKHEHLETAIKTEKLSATEGLMAEVLREGSVFVPNAQEDSRFPKFSEEILRFGSFIAVALRYRNEIYGVLALVNNKNGTPFTQGDLDVLESIAAQTAFSLHNIRVYSQLAEKKRLDHDIEVAREVQRILLPDVCPNLSGYQIAATNVAAKDVSGDYYDFIELSDNRWGMAIADVSGKGVPASLLMAMCRSVLRSMANENSSAADVLRKVNRLLYPDIREDMFITMTYAILDPVKRLFTLARAGHEAPLFCHNGKVETLKAPGMALGIDSGTVFDSIIADLTLPLSPEDAIVLYTDGVTEAMDHAGQEFGKDNLKEAIQASASDGAGAVVRNIVERLERFRGSAEKYDDVTLITLYVRNE